MTRANAIIGSALGGWLAFGGCSGVGVTGLVLPGAGLTAAGFGLAVGMLAGPAGAQQPGRGAPEHGNIGRGDAGRGDPGHGAPGRGPEPGSSAGEASGESLVEHLDEALRRALSGVTEGGAAIPAQGGMPLVARTNTPSRAVRSPVVIELFTSQGCSSCPPVDTMFSRIAQRQDVIALSLHVDYWDYLGWEDAFAQPAFTARQKAYARASGSRAIFTPQMIVEGSRSLIGGDREALEDMVAEQQAKISPVTMTVSGNKGQYVIELYADPPLSQGVVVQIVRYAPQARVEILRGENAGLVVDYANVVTAWHAVADWDGRNPTRITAKIEGDQPAVAIVQTALPGKSSPLPGAILAAAKLAP